MGFRSRRPGRVACISAGKGDVLGDNCTRADDDVVTHRHWQDGRVASNGDAVTDPSRLPEPLVAASRAAVRKKIVDEHDAVGNHAVLAYGHQFAYEGV